LNYESVHCAVRERDSVRDSIICDVWFVVAVEEARPTNKRWYQRDYYLQNYR